MADALDFVHLHVHTYFSVLDGQSPINKIVDKAIADGMRGMAITDHGNMFGVKELYDYCNKVNKKLKSEGKEPFKPIFGCEMYVAHRGKAKKTDQKRDRSGWHLIVLAKNLTGYHNLVKLVSRSWVDGFYGRPRTDHEDLEKYREGLIICSACLGGEVPQKILEGDIDGARETVRWFKSLWGDDYYLELQRHEVKDPRQVANRETFPEQQKVNAVLMDLAKEFDVKLVCTNDCHFVDEETAEAHDHLLCLSTGKDLDDPSRMRYSKQEWFKTRAEMTEVFADVPEALTNTVEVLDKVETYSLESDPIMPFFPIPETFGTEEQWRQKYTEADLFREFTSDENGENPLPEEEGLKKIKKLGGYDKLYRVKFEADYLAKLAYEGAQRIYGSGTADNLTADKLVRGSYGIPSDVEDRIRFELHIMKTMGFPGYFLIVQDFINAARTELDVWVGPGRGSAAGSVVAYCLGITKIDPLKYDLLFERFLNPDRISLPDIDTDFDDDGRGKVLRWVMDKYGEENCAHIITYAAMATKNAIKDVARVEKVPLDIVNAWCKAIPDRLPDGDKMNLPNAIKHVPLLQEAENSSIESERNTIKYARMLEGTMRGTGIHACGFIICRDPISDHVPVSTADDPDFPDVKTAVTQYDGHVIESTGLIKMDFLGLKTLSEEKEACKNIKHTRGIDLNLDTIPIDDPKTFELYQKGQTVGTFQFESAGMQKYLRELHPTVFEDLIAMNALYRPGPMDYIPSFIARKNGKEPITYDIDCMEKYLKDTYGITVYQEQVMLLSRQLAGFTRGESDALRKAMGKKKKDIVDAMKPKFIEGGKKNGHDPKVLDKIWGDWEKFASYAFNKSHAACYSWVAYQTAYLKANYPAEFMAALLTRRKDDIGEVEKLMDECKSMGLKVKSPDINESELNFAVNKQGEILFGLGGVKGVGEGAVEAIVSERDENGPYKGIFDFVERVNLKSCNRKAIESLADAGAFDKLGDVKREQFFALSETGGISGSDILVRYGNTYQTDKEMQQNTLFGDMSDSTIMRPMLPEVKVTWTDMERLNREKSVVGMYMSAHPLDMYSFEMEMIVNTPMIDLKRENLENIKGKNFLAGGIVTSIRNGTSKAGNPYCIVKIEDKSGEAEIPLFGRTHTSFAHLFAVNSYMVVGGTIVERKNKMSGAMECSIELGKVGYLSDLRDETRISSIVFNLNLEELDNELIDTLDSLFVDTKELNQRVERGELHDKKSFYPVCFNVSDPCEGDDFRISLMSTRYSVEATPDLVKTIDKMRSAVKMQIRS